MEVPDSAPQKFEAFDEIGNDSFKQTLQGMNEWQYKNAKDVFYKLHPEGIAMESKGDDEFKEFVRQKGREMDLVFGSDTSYTEVVVKAEAGPHKLEGGGPGPWRQYRAYLRPTDGQKKEGMEMVEWRRKYFQDLGDAPDGGFDKIPAGKGLDLDRYCRLMWVLDFQWRVRDEADPQKYVTKP